MELIYFSGFKSGLPHSLHVWVLWNQYVSAHGRRQRDGYPRAAQPFIKCKCWQLTHLLWYLLLVQTAKIFNLLEPRPFTSDPRYTKAELFPMILLFISRSTGRSSQAWWDSAAPCCPGRAETPGDPRSPHLPPLHWDTPVLQEGWYQPLWVVVDQLSAQKKPSMLPGHLVGMPIC